MGPAQVLEIADGSGFNPETDTAMLGRAMLQVHDDQRRSHGAVDVKSRGFASYFDFDVRPLIQRHIDIGLVFFRHFPAQLCEVEVRLGKILD